MKYEEINYLKLIHGNNINNRLANLENAIKKNRKKKEKKFTEDYFKSEFNKLTTLQIQDKIYKQENIIIIMTQAIIYLDDETNNKLDIISKRLKISKHSTIIRILKEYKIEKEVKK